MSRRHIPFQGSITLDDDKLESKLYCNVNRECPHNNRIEVNRGYVLDRGEEENTKPNYSASVGLIGILCKGLVWPNYGESVGFIGILCKGRVGPNYSWNKIRNIMYGVLFKKKNGILVKKKKKKIHITIEIDSE